MTASIPPDYFSDADGSAQSFDTSAREMCIQIRALGLNMGGIANAFETNRSGQSVNLAEGLSDIASAINRLAAAVEKRL